ncbi:MAG: tRNA (adenosine(37)-N6)-threonylcarbamoyltransferase complex ATPase subunit type 1 TsaE [Syntrophaceticus sp.]|nr:tRNA (adenosine(37)-N6)-threonylcarbamoyltransferase complex ATPase subunit type 1 TsaE [Syntrophaceticus sp.]MDD3315699.1 tRNA (adenosine(37)-N6)-threonylcarbamoyltransferase complex ATPase subunit type 1 TsaE [Syntrophaceticus sp.]MDD4360077.1 tRNA (adenosine(37)-N6)-threonylcarbamoyltransferase complex ATPase subunit type 1 TsaE [Syntrophaceticus sp.]MDD4783334.1 tRNA (adenosine(37)-N6)-threonylcarbamoyltransferase complex ATPase subunit type 1 TsaE [Syntrophaceticus sp.]
MWKINLYSSQVTEAVGRELGKLLVPGDFVSFIGELGAGKTTIIRGIASGLDVRDTVSSPSYLIIQEYKGKYPVFHGDFYRVGSYQELEDIGWEEYFQRDGIMLIEWGNQVPEAIPTDYLEVEIEQGLEVDERLFKFISHGKRYKSVVEELAKICGSWG